VQSAAQQSPSRLFPSSHSSPTSTIPFGHSGVDVGVTVAVPVAVGVVVAVAVAVGVFAGVLVGVLVGVFVGVRVRVLVGVSVGVCVGLLVTVGVGVRVGVVVVVAVGECVGMMTAISPIRTGSQRHLDGVPGRVSLMLVQLGFAVDPADFWLSQLAQVLTSALPSPSTS
jgi:hypothetical protein